MASQYLVFSSPLAAEAAVKAIDGFQSQQAGVPKHWSDVLEHPYKRLYAIPFDQDFASVIPSIVAAKVITHLQASQMGFYFGPLPGRFYKALHKCQEAAVMIHQLQTIYGRAEFPIVRALFLASQAALYSSRQSIERIINGQTIRLHRNRRAVEDWWAERKAEIFRKGELLHYLQNLNNAEKHGSGSFLLPIARFSEGGNTLTATGAQYMADALGTRFSSEGIFVAAPFAGKYEVWHLITSTSPEHLRMPLHEFTFALLGVPNVHLGQELPSTDPVTVSQVSLRYYFELVRCAIEVWAD